MRRADLHFTAAALGSPGGRNVTRAQVVKADQEIVETEGMSRSERRYAPGSLVTGGHRTEGTWRVGRFLPTMLASLMVMAGSAAAHVTLDPDRAQELLTRVAAHHATIQAAGGEPIDAETFFALGEAAERLVDLMNQDLAAHGQLNLLADLLVKRLRGYAIMVTYSDRDQRYAYDLAAFEEYLRRAPAGRRAPDAWFMLIARAFHRTMGPDPATLVNADLAAVARAVAAEERFLRDYPRHDRAVEVRFFLAVDYFRLFKNTTDPDRAAQYATKARSELERIRRSSPPLEARAAETLLERLPTLSPEPPRRP